MGQGPSENTGGRTTLRLWGPPSFIIAGILVAATLPLIPLIIPSLAPASTQAGLNALQSEGLVYGTTWVLYLVSDLLFLVAFFAIYPIIAHANLGLARSTIGLNTSFVALDVGLDIPLRLWLIQLSNVYTSATASAQTQLAQQAVSSADFAINVSNEVALVATLFQFTAVIVASFLLKDSPGFGKRTAYVGTATGIVSLLFIPAFLAGSQLSGIFNILGFVLLTMWSLLVGYKFRKLHH